MKKLLSLLLSVVMIFSTFGTIPMASATEETSPYGGPDYAAYPEEFEDYQWYAGWDYLMEWEEPENVWNNPWDKPVVIQTLLSTDGGATWSENVNVQPGQTFKARIRLAKNEIDYCQIDALEFTPVFRRSLFTSDPAASILLGIEEGYVDEAYSGVAYNTKLYPADTPKFWILWGENGDTTTGLTFDMCEYELTASAEIPEGEYTITTDLPCSVTYWDDELGDLDDKDRASDVDRLCYGVTNATVTVGGEEPEPEPEVPDYPPIPTEPVRSPYGGPDYEAYPEEFDDYQWYAGWDYLMEWEEPENVWDDPWDKPVVIQTLLSVDGDKWSDTLTVEPGQKFKARIRLAKNEIDYCQIDALEFTPVFRRSLFTVDQETSILLGITEGYVDEAYSGVAYNTKLYPANTPKFWILWGENGDTTTGLTFDMCEYELTASAEIPAGEYTVTTDLPCSVTYWDEEIGDLDDKDRASGLDRLCYGITNATVIVGGGEEPEPEPDPVPATAPEVALVAGDNAVVDGWNVTSWNATKGATVSVAVDDADGFTSTVTVAGKAYTAGAAIELEQGTYDVVVTTTAEGYIDTVTEYTITVPAGTLDKATPAEVTLVAGDNAEVDGWNVTSWNATKGATISVAVEDAEGFTSTVTVDGKAYTAGDAIAVADGTYDVVVTTTADKYEAVENTYTINISGSYLEDAVAPEVALVAGDNAAVDGWNVTEWNYTKGATVSVAVADADGFASTVRVDGVAYTAGDAIELAEGTYDVVVTTTADKYNAVTNEYTITVPAGIKEIADAPELTLVAGENVVLEDWDVVEWNATKGGTVSIEVVDVEGFTTTLTVNDEPYTPGDPIELAEGVYDVVVTTTADRYITRRATRFILVYPGTYEDAVAPEVTLESITAPVNGWTVEGWKREIANQVAVAVADAEGFTSTVTVNGEAYTAGDAIAVSKVGETFEVVVTTTADKYNTVENTYTITVGEGAMITSADIATMPTITMAGSEGLEFVDVVTPASGRGAGAIRNWTKGTEVTINVADNAEATSTVTVNGEAYTGEAIILDSAAPLCVVVHTKEAGKISATKVYDIVITKAEKAVLNSVAIELNGQTVDVIAPDSSVRTKTEAMRFVKGGANTMTISAVAEDGATVKVAMRGENSVEPLTTNLPYAAQFTAVVTVIKAGRVTASYVIDIPVKEAGKAPLESVVISGIGADITVDAPVASARTKAPTMAGFVKGEVDTITITPVVEDGLEAVVSFRGATAADALTATLPYASQFAATITVKGEGYQTAYYVIDIPVVK